MNAAEMARVYEYIRASTDRQIASPETQRQIIEDYARRLGRSVDRYFIDPAVSGKKSLFDREAGKELSLILKKGDGVIVARLDRLSRSFIGFARILEFWLKHKITMHLCDMSGGVLRVIKIFDASSIEIIDGRRISLRVDRSTGRLSSASSGLLM